MSHSTQPPSEMQRVFVYGSLLCGLSNHWLIEQEIFLGATETISAEGLFTMFDLGPFPGVIRNRFGGAELVGEMHLVDAETLLRLDELEEHPTVYQRVQIQTEMGPGWTYLWKGNGDANQECVPDCDWKTHIRKRGELFEPSCLHYDQAAIIPVSTQRKTFMETSIETDILNVKSTGFSHLVR